ncbi:HVO_0234 family beta-propeller protein [Halorubrum sp. HHNYT27]|uniref:HVO_0234 family beta-propeller protein n=1 Tax=Halorubrum sp. HHNYT27 TaxID=3402275 RepID=UPI003EBB1F67
MAPAEDDISIEEKRVYAGTAGRTDAFVATGSGVVRVALSADKVGAFDMVARDAARDVAVLPRDDGPDLVGIATAEGLRVAKVGDEPKFGAPAGEPAVAAGVHDGAFLVASEEGALDRMSVEVIDGRPTATVDSRVGTVSTPRAIDGPLIAAEDGVYRVTGGGGTGADGYDVVSVGLDDARDVAGSGMPLAATGSGLYWLGNGWMTALTGTATAVAADGDGHAMAVVDGDLWTRDGDEPNGEHERERGQETDGWDSEDWRAADLPVDEEALALGYGPGVSVAVTAAGTLCVDAGDGWRHQVIGVRDVAGVALALVE